VLSFGMKSSFRAATLGDRVNKELRDTARVDLEMELSCYRVLPDLSESNNK
jgi:hypothetical protein